MIKTASLLSVIMVLALLCGVTGRAAAQEDVPRITIEESERRNGPKSGCGDPRYPAEGPL